MKVRAESETRVGVSLWEDKKTGELAAFVYNTDFDVADIKIITDGKYRAEILAEDGNLSFLSEGNEFILPSVEAFGVRVLKLTK